MNSLALAQELQPASAALDFVSGEILIQFKADVDSLGVQNTLLAEGLYPLDISPYSGLMRVQVPRGREAEIAAAMQQHPAVNIAQLNYILSTAGTPNDPGFGQQWGLNNTGQTGGAPNADINAPEAWDIYTGSSTSTIAVVDTGVDLDHVDLQANIWTNSAEIPNNGLDDDGNGYIDDVTGWDFCNSPFNSSFVRCTSPQDNVPDDENGHGTHVAGIAAARGNNGIGVAGVSWAAKIMPVKVLDQFGNGTIAGVANGISYAAANGATVINMSLGAAGTAYPCTGFEPIRAAMQDALANGILVIVASGNQAALSVSCPAAYDEAFAVGATTHNDVRWFGSNRGSRLDIAAPGESIYSTFRNNLYGLNTGTSMATPYVAGLAALLKSFAPALPHTDVRSIIESTAKDLGSAGQDINYGHGRIDAYQALSALINLQTSPAQTGFLVDDNTLLPLTQNIQVTSSASNVISWTASISPAVPWLSISSATFGAISTASSPQNVTLAAIRPVAYGTYTTTVIVTGTTASGQSLGTRSTLVNLNYVPKVKSVYLPVVMHKAGPDLIVDSITATANNIQVVVKNQGSLPVVDAFWVDVYINPATPPTGVNQAWYDLGTQGLVWGVTTLPLASGDTITLTVNDAYYHPKLSNFVTPLPPGSTIYAQADSYNLATNYGAVFESNESNNISGTIFTSGAQIMAAPLTNGGLDSDTSHILPER